MEGAGYAAHLKECVSSAPEALGSTSSTQTWCAGACLQSQQLEDIGQKFKSSSATQQIQGQSGLEENLPQRRKKGGKRKKKKLNEFYKF